MSLVPLACSFLQLFGSIAELSHRRFGTQLTQNQGDLRNLQVKCYSLICTARLREVVIGFSRITRLLRCAQFGEYSTSKDKQSFSKLTNMSGTLPKKLIAGRRE